LFSSLVNSDFLSLSLCLFLCLCSQSLFSLFCYFVSLSGAVLFYCGRNVGQGGYANSCGKCDGHCGPVDGCQCRACFVLDHPTSK
jgi:hypothetical protein